MPSGFGAGRLLSAIIVAAAICATPSVARADDVRARAKAAYEEGAAAAARRDYAEAARRFAAADELAPNDVTLTEALKAAAHTDDAALAMRLVDRATARGATGALAAAASAARDKLGAKAGRIILACPDERPCDAKLDGEPAAIGPAIWVGAGPHRVAFSIDREPGDHSVDVAGGASVTFRPQAPAPTTISSPPPGSPSQPPLVPAPVAIAPPPPPRRDDRISPAWFWIAAGTTVALGATSAWSGSDALSLHDAWEKGDDASRASGKDAQLRTNVLLGVTGAALVGTVILAVVTFKKPSPAATSARTRLGPLSGAF